MIKTYCPSCGSPNEYSITIPRFCGQCAKPLQSTSASFKTANIIQKANRPNKVISASDEEDDDHIDNNIIPQLDKLEIDLDLSDTRGFTIGQIAASAKVEVVDKKVKAISKKQALEDFQKAASALKKGESAEIT